MMNDHLTDNEIQQYALDNSDCPINVIDHVEACEECKLKAENYRLLFTGINLQPVPVFDFDLEKSVLAELTRSKRKSLPENLYIYGLVIAGSVLIGVALYFYGNYIADLFAGVAPLSIYLLATTVMAVLIALGIDMYKGYQKKMRALNLY
jgi:hypothetical protein